MIPPSPCCYCLRFLSPLSAHPIYRPAFTNNLRPPKTPYAPSFPRIYLSNYSLLFLYIFLFTSIHTRDTYFPGFCFVHLALVRRLVISVSLYLFSLFTSCGALFCLPSHWYASLHQLPSLALMRMYYFHVCKSLEVRYPNLDPLFVIHCTKAPSCNRHWYLRTDRGYCYDYERVRKRR